MGSYFLHPEEAPQGLSYSDLIPIKQVFWCQQLILSASAASWGSCMPQPGRIVQWQESLSFVFRETHIWIPNPPLSMWCPWTSRKTLTLCQRNVDNNIFAHRGCFQGLNESKAIVIAYCEAAINRWPITAPPSVIGRMKSTRWSIFRSSPDSAALLCRDEASSAEGALEVLTEWLR